MPNLFTVLFIVALLPMVLAGVGGYLRSKQPEGFDNQHPRQQQAKLTGMAARVVAAQQNAWEALIFYTAACVLAYVSGVYLDTLAYPATLFLLSRLLHPVFYAFNMDKLRSLVFMLGWFATLYILIVSMIEL